MWGQVVKVMIDYDVPWFGRESPKVDARVDGRRERIISML